MAMYRPFENLSKLLKDMQQSDSDSNMADIHKAAASGDNDAIIECLQSGEDINAEDSNGHTALYIATKNGHSHAIKILLRKGARVNLKENPLHVVRNLTSAQLLVNADADINARDNSGYTPFHRAIETCDLDVVEFLLEKGSDINSANAKGEKVLHTLCKSYIRTETRQKLVPMLIDMGASVNCKDSLGKSPLHSACDNLGSNNRDIIEILIRSGASVTDLDLKGWSPLHYIVEEISSQFTENMQMYSSVEMNEDTGYYLKPICNLEYLCKLIDIFVISEAIANAKTFTGQTILHISAPNAHLSIIKHLVRKGSSVNILDGCKRSPMHCLVERKDFADILKVFVKSDADINSCDIWGQTTLHLAAQKGHAELVKQLLSYGANVNLGDRVGRRPLHYAAEEGNEEICEILFHNGANIGSIDIWLATPLHFAAWNNQPGTANFLLKVGADLHKEDKQGEDPISTASFRSSDDFLRVVGDIENSPYLRKSVKELSKYGDKLLQLETFSKIIDSESGELLRNGSDVDKFLSLVNSTPTVSNAFRDNETFEIQNAVETWAQNISKMLTDIHPKMKGSLLHAGSSTDGTKTRYPDEYDFMFCLEELSESIYVEQQDEDCSYSLDVPLVHPYRSELDKDVDYEEKVTSVSDYVNVYFDEKKSKYEFPEFTDRESKLLPNSMAFYTFSQLLSKIVFSDSLPKDPRLIILGVTLHPTVSLQWRGCRFKSLDISVDFVPAVRLPSWPQKSTRESAILTEDILSLPCLAVPKMPSESAFDLWRCSLSIVETTIIRKCKPEIRNSYLIAKSLVSYNICPRVSFEDYEMAKRHYREEHDSLSSDEEFELFESAEEILPSYLLKMAFLFCLEKKVENEGLDAVFVNEFTKKVVELKTDNLDHSSKANTERYGIARSMHVSEFCDSFDKTIVHDIFQRCAVGLSEKFVPSFFNHRQNILGSRLMEGDAQKALHFVRYIQKVLDWNLF